MSLHMRHGVGILFKGNLRACDSKPTHLPANSLARNGAKRKTRCGIFLRLTISNNLTAGRDSYIPGAEAQPGPGLTCRVWRDSVLPHSGRTGLISCKCSAYSACLISELRSHLRTPTTSSRAPSVLVLEPHPSITVHHINRKKHLPSWCTSLLRTPDTAAKHTRAATTAWRVTMPAPQPPLRISQRSTGATGSSSRASHAASRN